jgi:hypothetical protein
VVVSLPLLVAQGAIVILAGLPLSAHIAGLLWEQALVFLSLLLPMMVMGALTRSLVQFAPLAIVVALAAAFMSSLPYFRLYHPPAAPLAWIPISLMIVVATVVAACVLALSYARRRMAPSRGLAVGGACATIGIVMFMPWQTVAAIQQRVTDPLPQVSVALAPATPRIAVAGATNRGVQFELNVQGLHPGQRVTCEADTIDIEASNGRTFHSAFVSNAPWVAERTCPIGMLVPADFLDASARGGARVRAALYVSVYEVGRANALRVGEGRRFVPGLGFCAATTDVNGTHVDCRTAFQPHRVDADPHGSFEPNIPGLSYSPFPADLRIYPVEDRLFYFPPHNEQPTITTRTAIAHLKLDLDVPDVHLPDYEFGG